MGLQMSGNAQPSESMPPGHIISSGPHFMGGAGSQAEAATAKRVKVTKAFMVIARIQLSCLNTNLCELLYRKIEHVFLFSNCLLLSIVVLSKIIDPFFVTNTMTSQIDIDFLFQKLSSLQNLAQPLRCQGM